MCKISFVIAAVESLIEFKETHQRDKPKRTEVTIKVREIEICPPRNPSRTRGKARRTTHPRGTYASYATDLTGLSSV